MLFSLPISIGIALFITDVAPERLRRPFVYTVDLLAAIPSVVYGLWALLVLTEPLGSLYQSLSDATASIPILKTLFANPSASGKSFMTAGIIVAIMITPIITSITREVFATVPASQKEAALALGATRWEMIRGAVFPHSRSGMVAGTMIGLGRAMGETIAIALVIGASQRVTREHPRARRHARQRHRQPVWRGQRYPPGCAHRLRGGAVRHHDRDQHGVRARSSPVRTADRAVRHERPGRIPHAVHPQGPP